MPEHAPKAAVVPAQPRIECALAEIEEPSVLRALLMTQKAAAQHGGERERDKSGDQNRGADGDREFMQQAPDNSSHEQ